MRVRRLHAWDVSLAEAKQIQVDLASRLQINHPLRRWTIVVGADVSYNLYSNTIFAAAVVWRASDNAVLETRSAVRETSFPYRSGFLSFREAPALLAALRLVRHQPDVVVLDGQGIAHPRRMGLASHVGLFLDVPTIGAAKSRLAGRFDEPGPIPGDRSPIELGGELVGMALRTRHRSAPLFVSPGNGIEVGSAVEVVGACLRGYRLPEPTRLAHEAVNAIRHRHARVVKAAKFTGPARNVAD
jgi:deoxyribonuclease V